MKEEYSSDVEQFVRGSPESRRCGRGTECKPEEQREESLRETTRVWIRLQVAVQTMAGFPGGASGEEPACRCRRHKPIEPANVGSVPGLGRSPGGRHGVFLPGESYRQKSLVDYSSYSHKDSEWTE